MNSPNFYILYQFSEKFWYWEILQAAVVSYQPCIYVQDDIRNICYSLTQFLTFRTVNPANLSALAGLFELGPQWYDNEHD